MSVWQPDEHKRRARDPSERARVEIVRKINKQASKLRSSAGRAFPACFAVGPYFGAHGHLCSLEKGPNLAALLSVCLDESDCVSLLPPKKGVKYQQRGVRIKSAEE